MAEVILVYPKSSFIETAMKSQYLPLGFLQTVIFAEKEFSVKIIDQRFFLKWDRAVLDEINKDTLCVGVTALTGEMINHALDVSRFVKESSSVPVIWGGVHPTLLPEETLKNKFIDMVVIGEGEKTFHELLKALRDNNDLAEIAGLAYKKDGRIKINPHRKLSNLDDLPEPPYHLVDIEKYIVKFRKKNMIAIETSRGCPYPCTFCYSKSYDFKKKWRSLSADKTVKRVRDVKEKFNIDGIEIVDDNFFVNSKRAKEILSRLAEEKLDVFLNINGTINDILRLNNGNLDLLEQSNVQRLAVGVESGSQRILDLIRKSITIKDIIDFKNRINKTKVPPYYNFIGGFPTETESDLRQTTELIFELLKNNSLAKVSIFHCFRPLPGTKLIDDCVENGLDMPRSLEEWGRYTMTWIEHPWISRKLKRKIQMINFISLFLDNKYEEVDSKLVRIFAFLYKPIAYLRLRTLSNFLFIEDFLLKLYERIKR